MKRINYPYLKKHNEFSLLIKINLLNLFRQKRKKGKNPKNILVVDSYLIGDFIASLHAVRHFIKNSNATVDLLVPREVKPLAEKIRGVHHVFALGPTSKYDSEKSYTGNDFPKYDLVLIIRICPDSYQVVKRLKFDSIKTYLSQAVAFFISAVNAMFTGKDAMQCRRCDFKKIGELEKVYGFDEIFHFEESDYEKIKNIPEMQGLPKKMIIHTGSGWSGKLWDDKKWIELLELMNQVGKCSFIFVGGTNQEEDSFETIQSQLKFKIYSLIHKVDLAELMLVLRESDFFIGVDSGPMNMAYLAGLPSVSLVGVGPNLAKPDHNIHIVIDKSNILCTHIFYLGKKSGMQRIGVDEVFHAFIENSPSRQKDDRSGRPDGDAR